MIAVTRVRGWPTGGALVVVMRRLELRVNETRVAPTNTSELMMDGETSLSRYEIARGGGEGSGNE